MKIQENTFKVMYRGPYVTFGGLGTGGGGQA